ncbi:uridine kinase [Actinotalea ferrariae]|uniref:uridine kinase n=1 Tax=Actinotalea ferrariae TaxID=1386098 RepID=UPI001C8B3996|nr:uridine kinase [Actinotalea ferrariae]MBX9246839.1 uridine kinase [Actinotalea ferrariae]
MDRPSLLALLADRITARGARVVAVDGVDGAGKTVLADALGVVLAGRGRDVVRVGIDGFHHPRAVRYRRGRTSPMGFYRDSYDVDRFRAEVVDAARTHGAVRTAAFDHRTDRPVEAAPVPVAPDGVVLVDGIFLHRPELDGAWDLSVFLRASFAATFARMSVRDGCPPDWRDPANARYVEGQRLYLAEIDPEARADVVVDNDDPARPVLVRDVTPG